MRTSRERAQPMPPKKRARSSDIYVVRWARCSRVNGWDDNEFAQIETCGGTVEEAEGYVFAEIRNIDGVGDDSGSTGVAYTSRGDALAARDEQMRTLIKAARSGVAKTVHLSAAKFEKVRKGDYIAEFSDEPDHHFGVADLSSLYPMNESLASWWQRKPELTPPGHRGEEPVHYQLCWGPPNGIEGCTVVPDELINAVDGVDTNCRCWLEKFALN